MQSPNYKEIQKKAENYIKYLTYPPIPIKDIVEENGVDVVFVRFEKNGNKVAGFTKFDEAKIYVNAEDPLNRQIFTIAHEFGHWVLHRELFEQEPGKYNVLLRTPQGLNNNPIEKEANAFAANILVPQHLLKPIKEVASIGKLADIFCVSRETIIHRLKYV